MSVDVRGFQFALEPLWRQRQWELETLQCRLAEARRHGSEGRTALEALRLELQTQGRGASEALAQRLDPVRHASRLRWLSTLRSQVSMQEERVAELRREEVRLAADCAKQQNQVDAVEACRDDALADFARHEERRLAAESDRDWLARRSSPVARQTVAAAIDVAAERFA
jgi:hypothetical protein